MVIAALLCWVGVLPAIAEAREFKAGQGIEPYRVEVAFDKTVHILFPAAVEYVDLGSTNLIAGKADGAQNVVRIKAAVRGFAGETNFTVITAAGVLYTFNAVYAEKPAMLSVVMEDWLRKDPYGTDAEEQAYIRMDELGNESPLQVNRIMYSIYKMNARHIKTIGSKRFGIQLLLNGIYVEGDLIYFHTSLRNFSKVGYDIDHVRFRISDRKVAKRTAVQETFIEPVRRFNETVAVEAGGTLRNVYAFKKFTIPDDKVLVMDVFEKNGGRHQSFMVENIDLVYARNVEELNMR